MNKYTLWISCGQYYFSDSLNELLQKKEKYGGQIYESLKLNVVSAKDKPFEETEENKEKF